MVNHCSVRCSTGIDAQIRQHYLTYSRSAHLRQSYIKEPRHAYCKGEKDFIIIFRSYNVCITLKRITGEKLGLIYY